MQKKNLPFVLAKGRWPVAATAAEEETGGMGGAYPA